MLQLPPSRAILFWPKFYYSLVKYKEGRRSFWSKVTNPLGADYRRPVRQSNQITWLNVRYYCHPFYQVKGAYTHLHQQSYTDLEYAVAAATAKVFYYDTLNLAIPCTFLLELLPDPTDGALKSMLLLTLILFIYLYLIVRGLIIHLSKSIFASILSKENSNVFVRQGIHRRAKCRPMPTLYSRSFATADYHSKDPFLWNIGSITFLNDNSATAVIISQRILFVGHWSQHRWPWKHQKV